VRKFLEDHGGFPQRKKKEPKKKEKFGRGDLLKLTQPWKSGQGGLRRHLIGGFPPLLEKASAQNALAFSQLQQVRRRLTLIRDHLIDFSCLSFGVRSIRSDLINAQFSILIRMGFSPRSSSL